MRISIFVSSCAKSMKYKKTINKNSKIKWQHYKQSEVKALCWSL